MRRGRVGGPVGLGLVAVGVDELVGRGRIVEERLVLEVLGPPTQHVARMHLDRLPLSGGTGLGAQQARLGVDAPPYEEERLPGAVGLLEQADVVLAHVGEDVAHPVAAHVLGAQVRAELLAGEERLMRAMVPRADGHRGPDGQLVDVQPMQAGVQRVCPVSLCQLGALGDGVGERTGARCGLEPLDQPHRFGVEGREDHAAQQPALADEREDLLLHALVADLVVLELDVEEQAAVAQRALDQVEDLLDGGNALAVEPALGVRLDAQGLELGKRHVADVARAIARAVDLLVVDDHHAAVF